MLKPLAFVSLSCLLAGACVDNGDGDPGADPDANVSSGDPDAGDPQVVCQDQGLPYEATVNGTVIDFVTGDPYLEPVDLDFGAWQIGFICFQGSVAAQDGALAFENLAIRTVRRPPIFAFSVAPSETGLAPMVSDRTMDCPSSDENVCQIPDFVMPVLAADIEQAWRQQLAEDGMPDAATRGLVLYEFRETDGTGAAGVVPGLLSALAAERALVPGVDFRFVDADRMTLLAPETEATSASGLVIIALPQKSDSVFGSRGSTTWEAVGVLAIDGAFFVEATRPTTAAFRPEVKPMGPQHPVGVR